MADGTNEDATKPTGYADAKRRMLDVCIIRNREYERWKKDQRLCRRHDYYQQWKEELGMGPQPRGSTNTIHYSTPRVVEERFGISHFSEHLAIWEKQLPNSTVQPFYSFSDVNAMTENSPKRFFQYEMDGLTWSCEYSVKTRVSKAGHLMKTLVIHLPIDGFFYIPYIPGYGYSPYSPVYAGVHMQDQVSEKTLWITLKPFVTFMATWCGNNYDPQRLEKAALYHSDANRVDICMRMDHIEMKFSFQPSFPDVLNDDW